MLSFPHAAGRFNYRVAGICIDRGRLLLHRSDRDDFWSLPGGRCEFGEESKRALKRELEEELEEDAEVDVLRWTVENFYRWAGEEYHELAFYYDFSLPAESTLPAAAERRGRDGELELRFRWFAADELGGLPVYPSFIPDYAFEKPAVCRHLVWREPAP